MTLPLFEGLYLEDLMKFAKTFNGGEIMMAFPEVDKEIKMLPREYVGNVIQTIAKVSFTQWVKARVDARNDKVAKDRELAIEMD